MKSIILSKTDKYKYLSLCRALNFSDIHCSFHDENFDQGRYDLIFCDEVCLPFAIDLQKAHGGLIVSNKNLGELNSIEYDVQYGLDSLVFGKKIDYLECDVAYVGDWNQQTIEHIPSLTNMNNPFSTKIFGPPKMSSIEGYFWDFKTSDIAANARISFIIDGVSRPEHEWEALANGSLIITPDTKSLIIDKLSNLQFYQIEQEEMRQNRLNTSTYFHQIVHVLEMIRTKYQSPQLEPIIESVKYTYDKNRIHCGRSDAVPN